MGINRSKVTVQPNSYREACDKHERMHKIRATLLTDINQLSNKIVIAIKIKWIELGILPRSSQLD